MTGGTTFEARSRQLKFRQIVTQALFNALSFTQAIAWGDAVTIVVNSALPIEMHGPASAVLSALSTTAICVFIASMLSRCVTLYEDLPSIEVHVTDSGTTTTHRIT